MLAMCPLIFNNNSEITRGTSINIHSSILFLIGEQNTFAYAQQDGERVLKNVNNHYIIQLSSMKSNVTGTS